MEENKISRVTSMLYDCTYLLNKSYSESVPQWYIFIKKLYETIIDKRLR